VFPPFLPRSHSPHSGVFCAPRQETTNLLSSRNTKSYKMAEKEFSLTPNIPNFYYDIMTRIIPGCVLIGSYSDFGKISISEFQSSVFFLLSAYLLGYVLNLFSVDIWDKVFYTRKYSTKVFKKLNGYNERDVWDLIRKKVQPENRDILIKMLSEFLMMKSLSLVAAIWLISPPNLFSKIHNLPFPGIILNTFGKCPRLLPAILFAIILRCVYRANLRIIRNVKVHSEVEDGQ
jgi:hypothetical protein